MHERYSGRPEREGTDNMLKGDIRKKQILETAETLFAERGYEETGVQAILDELHLSKGSFYHHFESKEQVLQKICERRAGLAAEKLKKETWTDGLAMMNGLLHGMIPFQGEGLRFLRMILPVFLLPEGKSIRSAYQAALKSYWMPMAEEALQRMTEEGTAFTLYPQKTVEMALDLVNNLWAEIGEMIIGTEKNHREAASAAQVLNLVEPYRPAIENLFSAPYGSLELIRLHDIKQMIDSIHDWWMVDPADHIPGEES